LRLAVLHVQHPARERVDILGLESEQFKTRIGTFISVVEKTEAICPWQSQINVIAEARQPAFLALAHFFVIILHSRQSNAKTQIFRVNHRYQSETRVLRKSVQYDEFELISDYYTFINLDMFLSISK
jgi:hypothetical protein